MNRPERQHLQHSDTVTRPALLKWSHAWVCHSALWGTSPRPRDTGAGQVRRCLWHYHFPDWRPILVKAPNSTKHDLSSAHIVLAFLRSYLACAKGLCLKLRLFNSRLESLWLRFSSLRMSSRFSVPCPQDVSSILPQLWYDEKHLHDFGISSLKGGITPVKKHRCRTSGLPGNKSDSVFIKEHNY